MFVYTFANKIICKLYVERGTALALVLHIDLELFSWLRPIGGRNMHSLHFFIELLYSSRYYFGRDYSSLLDLLSSYTILEVD